jgi:subtilisin family serine protease
MKFAVLTLLAVAVVSNATPLRDNSALEDVLVQFKNPSGKAAAFGASVRNNCPNLPDSYGVACVRLPTLAIEALKKDPNIVSVSADQTYNALGWREEDPITLYLRDGERNLAESLLWGIQRVQADQVQQVSGGNKKTKVCVIDTGYALGHPDLPIEYASGGWVEGINTTSSLPWKSDLNGHGSHCAGTVGEIGGNNIGYWGVNPTGNGFGLIICRGLADSGSGTLSIITQAVSNCASFKNADTNVVISMSLGSSSPNAAFKSVLDQVYDQGVLIVAAAGNNGSGASGYPAQYPSVISVGASSSNNQITSWSTKNSQVELAAPGDSIVSTTVSVSRGRVSYVYAQMSGTSMACPHVAAVAAKVWAHFHQCTNKQIQQAIIQTAKLIDGSNTCNISQGHGLVQAKAMFDLLSSRGCGAVSEGTGLGGCLEKQNNPTPQTPAPVTTPQTPAPVTTPQTPAPIPTCRFQYIPSL